MTYFKQSLAVLISLMLPLSMWAQADLPCTAYQSHDFDYMLGDWQVLYKDSTLAYSSFKKEFGNCSIQEQYKEPSKGYLRNTTATFNTIKGKWELCTYDNNGEFYNFLGATKGKNIELEAEKLLPNGKIIYLQLIYSAILENSFEREIKLASDSNKVYKSFNKVKYQRIMNSEINGKKIYHEIVVKASPNEVYERWTQKSGILKFMADDCYIIMEPGGPYEIYFMNDAPKGFKGSETCKVLSYIENKMLSFTWNAPPQFPTVRNSEHKAWVVIELEKMDDEHTKVKLTHTGWRDGDEWNKVFIYFDNAWPQVLERLRNSF